MYRAKIIFFHTGKKEEHEKKNEKKVNKSIIDGMDFRNKCFCCFPKHLSMSTHTALTPAINSVREITFLLIRNIQVLMFV